MSPENRSFGKSTFGRGKKNNQVSTVTDLKSPLPPPSDAPRVGLPRMETCLNMHQYNGLFEVTPERPNGSTEPPAAQPLSSPTNGDTPSATPSAEWSSAVGHAATGKSGRVIHNLQEDIARLTRECSVYRSRAEEAHRINDVFKTQMQTMTEQIRNLELANETNLHSIARKDRKIEDLRLEIQSERDRRRRAESETDKINQLMTENKDEFHRKCAELQEMTSYTRTQYDVLLTTRQREQADQQRKVKAIRGDFIALQRENEKRNAQLEQLDTVMAHKNREIEASKENLGNVFQQYEAYKAARDLEVRDLIEKGHQNEADIDHALASLKQTEREMKWAIRVKNEVRNAQ